MTHLDDATPALASDPSTPAQLLAEVAQHRPDLRPYVAANPAAYPGLLTWLGSLGDPSVDAALRGRGGPGGAPGREQEQTPAWGHQPARGWGQEGAPVQAPASASGGQGDLAPVTAPGAGAAGGLGPTTGAPALPLPSGGYGGSAGGGVGPTSDGTSGPGWSSPVSPSAPGGSAFDGPPPGGFTPGIHPGQWGPPPAAPKRSLTWLWVLLGVLAVLAVGGVLLVVGLVRLGESQLERWSEPASGVELEELREACGNGDWAACDDLYLQAPVGSEYEEFGDTCGGLTGGTSWCVDEFGEDGAEVGTEPWGYGDDPVLDALHDACAAGDGQACDDLFMDSPWGSEYEAFGDTCGGTRSGGEYCAP